MKTRIGVFAIDPGGTTGCAWGVFTWKGTVGKTVAEGPLLGSAQVSGSDELQHASEVLALLRQFSALCSRAGVRRVEVVIEDFVLRPQIATKGREMLSPVRITALLEGLYCGLNEKRLEYTLQGPSEAKGFATNERLAKWGVQTHGGGRHAKDAWRHIAVYLAKLTTNKGKKG